MSNLRYKITIVAMFLLVVVIAQPAFAGDREPAKPVELTLKDAFDVALSSNPNVLLANLDARDTELALAQAQANDLTRPSPTGIYQAQHQVEIQKRNLALAKLDLKLTVEQQYYAFLKAESMVAISEEALKMAKRQLEIVRAKREAGTVTELDVMKTENQVLSSEASLERAIGNRELARINFCQTLGLPIDSQIHLTDEFSFAPVQIDLAANIKEALDQRIELAQARSTIEVQEMNVRLQDNDYTSKLTLERTKIALEQAKVRYVQQKDKIIQAVHQSYFSLLDAKNQVGLLEKKLSEAKENLRIVQLLFDADMGTNIDVISAQNSLTQAQTDYLSGLFNFNTAKSQFYRALGRID